MKAHLFVIRNRTDGVPPVSSMEREAAPFCKPNTFSDVGEFRQIPVSRDLVRAGQLLRAHRIAAEVRARKPYMNVHRITHK